MTIYGNSVPDDFASFYYPTDNSPALGFIYMKFRLRTVPQMPRPVLKINHLSTNPC